MMITSPAYHRNSTTQIIPTRPTQKRPETTEFRIIYTTMKITLANVVASALLAFATAEEWHNLREVKSGKLSELADAETEGEFCGAQRRCVLQILIGLVLGTMESKQLNSSCGAFPSFPLRTCCYLPKLRCAEEYQQLSMSSLYDLFRPYDI